VRHCSFVIAGDSRQHSFDPHFISQRSVVGPGSILFSIILVLRPSRTPFVKCFREMRKKGIISYVMTQVFQFLTGFDDRSLEEEVWVERMLAAVVTFNEAFKMSLVPKATIEDYLKWEAVIRSKERVRKLREILHQK